jgi:hypothetical protein
MTNHDHEQRKFRVSQDELDRALDAALAKCAAEPRAGLENRILAGLRAEELRAESPAGRHRYKWKWLWPAATAAVLVALAMAWMGRSQKQPTVVNRPVVIAPDLQIESKAVDAQTPYRDTTVGAGHVQRPTHQANTHRSLNESSPVQVTDVQVADANPKLDQFPSRRPLSEKEKLALEYVRDYPEEAAMIAQAQVAMARQRQLEDYGPQPGETAPHAIEQLE